MSTAWAKPSTSNSPSARRKRIRLRLARLQAELSTCMYSEEGVEALMRAVFGQGCHSLISVSNWMPGSAHFQAASEICRIRSRARTACAASPVVREVRFQLPSLSTARMNSSVRRTELLAFWYWIEAQSGESSDMSYPAASSVRALSSSRALHQMNSSMSGWSTSSTTILAARRVLPPDLMVPADASAPRMNETGPEA